MWRLEPCFSSPNLLRACPVLLTLLFLPLLLNPTEFCVVLYILFHWSGTPVCSQLVFCMHFCVLKAYSWCIMERDVLHVHLLLCHLVLSHVCLWVFRALWTVAHQALCLWDFAGKNTGVDCHSLLRGSSQPEDQTQSLLRFWHILYHLNHQGRFSK